LDNETEVLATYEQYIKYFLANDVDGINSLVDYPITYIADGHCVSLDTYPVIPDDRRIEKSVIEKVSAFYAFHKKGNDWKMYAISDVVF